MRVARKTRPPSVAGTKRPVGEQPARGPERGLRSLELAGDAPVAVRSRSEPVVRDARVEPRCAQPEAGRPDAADTRVPQPEEATRRRCVAATGVHASATSTAPSSPTPSNVQVPIAARDERAAGSAVPTACESLSRRRSRRSTGLAAGRRGSACAHGSRGRPSTRRRAATGTAADPGGRRRSPTC